MTDVPLTHAQEAEPGQPRRRFYGWRLVWAGAFIIGIVTILPLVVTLPDEGSTTIIVGSGGRASGGALAVYWLDN